jgi:hypothetical protein
MRGSQDRAYLLTSDVAAPAHVLVQLHEMNQMVQDVTKAGTKDQEDRMKTHFSCDGHWY